MLTPTAHHVVTWVTAHTGPLRPLRPMPQRHPLQPGERWCTLHKRGCPIAAFTRNRSRPDGLETYCRQARQDWVRQHTATGEDAAP